MVTHLKLMVLLLLHIHGVRVNGHRILGIFIHIGGSHFQTFYPILNGLAESGHDVTVLSHFSVVNSHANYKQFVFDGIPVINSSLDLTENGPPSRSMYTIVQEFFELVELGYITCRNALKSEIIDKILHIHKNNPFDLVITEIFDTDCMLGVIYKMNVPYVGLASCGLMPYQFDRVSLPDTPSYVTSIYVGYSDEMSFDERLVNWLTMKVFKILYRIVERNDNKLLKEKFGDGIPDVKDLANNISLLLVNQHFSISGPRPLSPQVIEIGGVHIKPEKELPKNLKTILDNASHGVILISWGSNLNSSTISLNKLNSMTSALRRLKQIILWKWELDTMPNKPDNVILRSWLPQRDILCHPNVKLFWSHGGNLGVSESVYCGVPVISTPFYGDQFVNAGALKKRAMGETLLFDDLNNEQKIYETLHKVLQPSYAQRAKIISSSFRNRPMTPLVSALFWIEYVLNSGAELTKSSSKDLTWFVYHSVDVMLFLSLAFTFIGLVVLFIFRKCFTWLMNGTKNYCKLERKKKD